MTDARDERRRPTGDAEEMQAKLDDLGQRIDQVRDEARRRGVLEEPEEDEERFAESGEIRPELDDQTIAPPG